jgi:metal-dependent amidase/aminoacylase/carboxypeptidase family protein
VVKGICQASGAKYEFEYTLPYIPTINHVEYFEMAKSVAIECFGDDMWKEQEKSSMGGEDFSYFLQKCPGVYCNIGMGENHSAIHNPQFDFEDKAISNGIMFLVMMTLKTMDIV